MGASARRSLSAEKTAFERDSVIEAYVRRKVVLEAAQKRIQEARDEHVCGASQDAPGNGCWCWQAQRAGTKGAPSTEATMPVETLEQAKP